MKSTLYQVPRETITLLLLGENVINWCACYSSVSKLYVRMKYNKEKLFRIYLVHSLKFKQAKVLNYYDCFNIIR